ncbi:nickel pincer cofactor biosynthesis protein LarB [Microbaculum marinum]|uniref:Nickel pincer cofactor biosynthesis protein LarB n=1 Tax=Microbaculum marinum TaxID=1764581 RepID=A0AAW9RT79_9HYPH
MTRKEIRLDFERDSRLGFGEAALCAQKTVPQIEEILRQADDARVPFLLTRLDPEKHERLSAAWRERLDYHPQSRTGFLGFASAARGTPDVAVVTAGTSDAGPAHEALRTLEFNQIATTPIFDVGVAGIWRLMERVDEIARHPVVIAVAGMDAALPSVLGGLVPGAVIAVPTSTGYGMARDGETALNACLVSCAPGITVTNIDNGYGAACAAIRALKAMQMIVERQAVAKAAE